MRVVAILAAADLAAELVDDAPDDTPDDVAVEKNVFCGESGVAGNCNGSITSSNNLFIRILV